MRVIYQALSLFLFLFRFSLPALPQIPAAYEVGTWQGFKPAAVTYTFDDNTPKQLPVALPLFDQHKLKATFFVVTNWGPNWAGLRAAVQKGHELGSHTVSHASLNGISLANQENELSRSKSLINTMVPEARCSTIAYPNCNVGDIPTIQQYYLAGRVCSGAIEKSTPSDFYRISSIIAGSQGAVKTAADFNSKVAETRTAKGWCVFLLHGIDDDGGYSPLASSQLSAHLTYMRDHAADFWVPTFREAVCYIRERNALTLTETMLSADSLQLIAQDNLDDAVYQVLVSIRRKLPATWKQARVYAGGKLIESKIIAIGNTSYLQFEVLPDGAPVYLAKASGTVTGWHHDHQDVSLRIGPNPFVEQIRIAGKGAFQYAIYAYDGKLVEKGSSVQQAEAGQRLDQGLYLLRVYEPNQTTQFKIIKR